MIAARRVLKCAEHMRRRLERALVQCRAMDQPVEYRVFYAGAHSEHGSAMRGFLARACDRVQSTLKRRVRLLDSGTDAFASPSDLFKALVTADVVVVDLTEPTPNVMIELGTRIGTGKPFLLVSTDIATIPFDIAQYRRFIYDPQMGSRSLVSRLADNLEETLRFPDQWDAPLGSTAGTEQPPSVFVSYSHVDGEYLNRLRVHMKPLARLGLIEPWDDTKIKMGDRWKDAITAALERAAAAVLLISADFLASDFIVDNELPPLLKAAQERGTLILPLIVKPSRFLRDPNLNVFQAVNDPQRPLVSLPEAERETIYARMSEMIESALGPTVR